VKRIHLTPFIKFMYSFANRNTIYLSQLGFISLYLYRNNYRMAFYTASLIIQMIIW